MCGVLMVIGGLVLFYKGIVTLQEVSDKPDAVTIEFKNVLKIQSRYPAYGFFIFGLAFIFLSIIYGTPERLPPISLSGVIENAVDPSATRIRVLLPLWDTTVNVDGMFKRDLYPDLKQVRVEILAPGNDPSALNFEVDTTDNGRVRVAKFAPVKLKRVGGEPKPGLIESPAPGIKLAPIEFATGLKEVTP
jgi:hypothetical protein